MEKVGDFHDRSGVPASLTGLNQRVHEPVGIALCARCPMEYSGDAADLKLSVGNLTSITESDEAGAEKTEDELSALPPVKAVVEERRTPRKMTKENSSANQRDKKLKNLIRDIENQAPQQTRFMKIMSPNTTRMRYWTMVLTLLMMYLCTTIPLILAFGSPSFGSAAFVIILTLDCLSEAAFIVDIFLNFHLGYVDASGNEVLQPSQVVQRYLRGRFALDLIVTLPLDMGMTSVGSFLRILKMIRFFPVMARVSALEADSGMSWFARLVKLGFPMFLVFHIVGCCWISFGTHGDYGDTIFVPSNVVGSMSYPTQYIYSLFWSLSLLSNTSIPEGSPTNNLESIFAVIAMTLGLGVITYVVGAIGALMELKDSNRRNHEKHLRDLMRFLAFNEVPHDLQKRVTSYMAYKWTANEGFDPELLLSSLPKSLHHDLSCSLAREIVDQVPFFALLKEDALNAVILSMKPVFVMPHEYIVKMGAPSGTMYIVRDGDIHAIAHSSRYNFNCSDEENNRYVYGVETLTASDAFGIYESLVLKKYLISVRAATFVDLYAITADDFLAALAPFPDQLKMMEGIIEENTTFSRKMEALESITPTIPDPTVVNSELPTNPLVRKSLCVAAGIDVDQMKDASPTSTAGEMGKGLRSPQQHKIVQQMTLKTDTEPSPTRSISKASPRRLRLRRSLSSQRLNVSLRTTLKSGFGGIRIQLRYLVKHLVILPTTKFARIWYVLVSLVNLYNICLVPFRIVFMQYWWHPFYVCCDYIGDAIYLIDIFLNFHIAFLRHGHLVSQVSDITADYLKSKRFHRHVLASLPFDLIMIFTGPNALVRLPRIIRAPDVIQVMKSSNVAADPPWKNLTKKLGALVVQYLLIAHFIACGYFIFAQFDGYATDINRWLPPTFLNDDDQPVRKYLYGLYFSYDMLLRLGVGINPRTPPQIIFSIFTLLVGVLVVAQLIGSFSSFLQVYDHGESAFKDRMNQLSNYLTKNRVPKLIRKKVLNFYKSQWHDIGSVDMNTVLDVLPQRLREDVLFSIFKPVLDRVSELKKAPAGLLAYLSCHMVFEYYSESSYVFMKGDPADDVFFVRRGRVDVFDRITKKGKLDDELYDVVLIGRYFGEGVLLGAETHRSLYAQAKENTHLIRLNRRHFLEALNQFTEFKDNFLAVQRAKSMKNFEAED